MARDWSKALRPASFRAAPFRVLVEEAEGARRLSISPIAYGNGAVIEDMGREPRLVSLTAYVVGDAADATAAAVMAALDAKGPALLVLPMLAPLRARVTSWRLAREKDRAGFVAFDIGFIEEGLGSIPFAPVAGAGPVAALMADGVSILGAALASVLRSAVAGRETQDTRDAAAAADRMRLAASAMRAGAQIDGVSAATLDRFDTAAGDLVADPAGFAKALVDGWRGLTLSGDPEAAFAELRSITAAASVSSATGACERAATTAALAVATLRRSYAARQDAAAAREVLRLAAEPGLDAAARLSGEANAWLARLTGDAALHLSRTAASRAPVARIETNLSLSSIVAAYRLYGDANRSTEIVDRNRSATPAFLPLAFEALTE